MAKPLLLDAPGRYLYRHGVDLSTGLTVISRTYRVTIVAVVTIAVLMVAYVIWQPSVMEWLGIRDAAWLGRAH